MAQRGWWGKKGMLQCPVETFATRLAVGAMRNGGNFQPRKGAKGRGYSGRGQTHAAAVRLPAFVATRAAGKGLPAATESAAITSAGNYSFSAMAKAMADWSWRSRNGDRVVIKAPSFAAGPAAPPYLARDRCVPSVHAPVNTTPRLAPGPCLC